MNESLKPPDFLTNQVSHQAISESQSSRGFTRLVSAREAARRQRDIERGYSINVKQVVLAFAVEFVIIGLILVSQYYIAEAVAKDKVLPIILFPVALAVVELARVPLAIAVRTQNAWSVKVFAALGVTAAVVVTSFSLSTIAYQTFDPRLAEANEKNDEIKKLEAEKAGFGSVSKTAFDKVAQRREARDDVARRYQALQEQITKISIDKGRTCVTTTDADGKPKQDCAPTSKANTAQLKAIQVQLDNTKKESDQAEIALKEAESERAKLDFDIRDIDRKITAATDDYRKAIARSQMHSYTSMISLLVTGVRKAPEDVTEGEVKSIESYLIFIPSIAAALASTLLAITAVRRLRIKAEPTATIPDEAAAYLFGPLIDAIRKAAGDTIAAAMAGGPPAKAPT